MSNPQQSSSETVAHGKIHTKKTRIVWPGSPTVAVQPLEIVVWVSVTGMHSMHEHAHDPLESPVCPAVFSSGFSQSFLIHHTQLNSFCAFAKTQAFDEWENEQGQKIWREQGVPPLQIQGHNVIALESSRVWLRGNATLETVDHPIKLFDGEVPLLVVMGESIWPTLPVLGMAAIQQARLTVEIDMKKMTWAFRKSR